MDHHALAVLAEAELWDWPHLYRKQESGEQGGKYRALTAKLLYSPAAFASQGHFPTACLWSGFGIMSAGVTTAFDQIVRVILV
jgi:hypothetical protein